MGFTHYWSQKRNFTVDEWAEVREHIDAILKDVQHNQGIALANGVGDPGSSPEITKNAIVFNGLGKDSFETFRIQRVRDPDQTQFWFDDLCKTERRPYDLAVMACLSYLATVTDAFAVTSDGHGDYWLAGVEQARRALPRFANIIDIPMEIMKNDRWTSPRIDHKTSKYAINFCVDGKGYVQETATNACYCFESHFALAKWLSQTQAPPDKKKERVIRWGVIPATEPNIWDATGAFDEKRHVWLAKLQERACATLFPVPPESAQQPPAFVRPNQFPPSGFKAQSFQDLLNPRT